MHEGDKKSTPSPGRLTPGKDPVPIMQEAGWTSGPVWAIWKNPAPPPPPTQPELDSQTVQQHAASRYTDWAIPATGRFPVESSRVIV